MNSAESKTNVNVFVEQNSSNLFILEHEKKMRKTHALFQDDMIVYVQPKIRYRKLRLPLLRIINLEIPDRK